MGRIFSIVAGIAALMVLLAGGGAYWFSAAQVSETQQTSTTAIASGMTVSIVSQIETLQRVIDGLAQAPDVVAALASDSHNPATLDNVAARLQNTIPQALRVRLLPATVSEPDLSQVPNMGFADLEMVRATLTAKQKPFVQGEGEHRHLAMTAAVSQNQQVIGVILVSLKPDLLQQLISKTAVGNGYVEIKQEQAVLASVGMQELKAEEPQVMPLTNSRWSLELSIGGGTSTDDIILFSCIILIPALLGCLAFFIGYRKLADYLHHDQSSILKAAKDMMTGKQVGHYPVQLDEMRPIISTLAQFKRILEQEKSPSKVPDELGEYDFFDESFDIDFIEESPKTAEHYASVPVSLGTAPISVAEQAPLSAVAPAEKSAPVAMPNVAPTAGESFADIFRTYDIRGIVGRGLTPETVHKIGRALGSEARQLNIKTIVMGRDGRLSSPGLADALAKGITEAGCDVLNIGLVPTPLLYFVTQHSEGRSGVMITGSHNPADYNGLKLVLNGETLSGDKIQQLKKRIEAGDFSEGTPGSIELNSLFSNEYIGMISDDVHLVRPMKVAVDCGNGAAGQLAPILLRTMGCEVIELYCEIDGNFPNHHPDPSKPENLGDLIKAVKHYEADIGVAFDGDGDRIGVVDSGGKIIWPDRQMMLYARDVLANKPGAEIIYDVKCSRHLHDQIVKRGGRPLMWKSGHSLMKAKLKETTAALAGEMSGHIFFNDRWFGFDDALYAAARLIEILSADMRSSSDVFAELPDSINTPELHVPLAEGEGVRFVEQLFSQAKFKDGKIINIDGMRVEFADGWGLVRASNTTPVLTLRFEADSQDAMQRIQAQFRQLMLQIKPDIKLPF
ncbi:phosphomannomutase/phosphoglucomutase [Methylomonas sp. LW13]|uniref:phosphomannomutase/phosphoglucomutase n=1 Tax=unclassified Methylomonas TaxID=2608980 RepID=UPI00051B7739|nr:phosphomannomutase/phosphoglucomutase [Methylomonas sp. LW13]QBC29128.1 phosphomannomutase/phosphoglucomutase [Methylomonas sp. LW13]